MEKESLVPSRYDVSQHPGVDALLGQIPSLKHRPLVGIHTLTDVVKVIKALPKLEFPINSAGELIEKLGGSGTKISVLGIAVDPLRMIKYMPAYYFPIPDMDNFVEKMAELIRDNRQDVNVPREIESLRKQIVGR